MFKKQLLVNNIKINIKNMKWLDFIKNSGSSVFKEINSLKTRMNKRECYTKLKSYTTAEMNAIPDPEVGYLIYNTTATAVYIYKISGWAAV